jgi:hypothetical protein
MGNIITIQLASSNDRHLKSTDTGDNPGIYCVKNLGPGIVALYTVWNAGTVPVPQQTFPGLTSNQVLLLSPSETIQIHLDDDFNDSATAYSVWAHQLSDAPILKIWGPV